MIETIERTIQEFQGRSYYVQEKHFEAFSSTIPFDIQQQTWSTILRSLFVMIKPDAVATGKYHQIIEELEEHANIKWCRPHLHPVESEFEELYKYNLTLKNSQNQISSWWINRRLYTLGPSILLLLEPKDFLQPMANFYNLIDRLKGSSNPKTCSEKALRSRLKGTNLAMNLMHSADDPLSSFRELSIFVGLKTAINIHKGSSKSHSLLSNKKTNWNKLLNPIFESSIRFVSFNHSFSLLWNHLVALIGIWEDDWIDSDEFFLSMEEFNSLQPCMLLKKAESKLSVFHQTLKSNGKENHKLQILENLLKVESWKDAKGARFIKECLLLSPQITDWDQMVLLSTFHYWYDMYE